MDLPVWVSYPLITYLASLPFYWHIQRTGGVRDSAFASRLRLWLWVPAVVAFGLRIYSGAGFSDVHFEAGRWSLLLVAILLPLIVESALIVLAASLGWAALASEIVAFRGGEALIGERLGLFLGGERQSLPLFILNLVLSVTIGGVYSALFTLGAEFGWRGFMLPQAIDDLGLWGGFIATGLFWGYGYLPLVLMGYRFPRQPRLGALVLMPVTAIALTVIAGVLYFASDSIWTPTLFHAGLLVNTSLSRIGLGEHGEDLRVRLLWIALWFLTAGVALWLWL